MDPKLKLLSLLNLDMDDYMSPTDCSLAQAHADLTKILYQLCVRLDVNVMAPIVSIVPRTDSTETFVNAYLSAPRDQALALCLFTIFEVVQGGPQQVNSLFDRLAASMRFLVNPPDDITPIAHNGTQDPIYNLFFGLYLHCLVHGEGPLMQDFAAIVNSQVPNDPILAAFQRWMQYSPMVRARSQSPMFNAGLMWSLRRWLLNANEDLPQDHLLTQAMVRLERWGAEANVRNVVGQYMHRAALAETQHQHGDHGQQGPERPVKQVRFGEDQQSSGTTRPKLGSLRPGGFSQPAAATGHFRGGPPQMHLDPHQFSESVDPFMERPIQQQETLSRPEGHARSQRQPQPEAEVDDEDSLSGSSGTKYVNMVVSDDDPNDADWTSD